MNVICDFFAPEKARVTFLLTKIIQRQLQNLKPIFVKISYKTTIGERTILHQVMSMNERTFIIH